jgi:AcrR family transcriptional regulator
MKKNIIMNERSFIIIMTDYARRKYQMPKVTEEHREERRQHILDAAINCFTRNGFHQTTMKDISREASVSAGTAYIYFSSKEDIIEETLKRVREARAARFKAIEQEDIMQSFQEFWDSYRRRLAETSPDRIWQLGVQLLSEAIWNPRIRQSMREHWDDGEKNITESMRNFADQGLTGPDIDYDTLARLFIAVHDGLMIMKILNPERDLQKCFAVFNALIANYIRISTDNADERRPDSG